MPSPHRPPHPAARAPKLQRHPAAYTPGAPRPICPRCWSRPDLEWGKGRDAGARGMRGWRVSSGPEPLLVGGTPVPLTTAIHRCANPDCATAIELVTRLTGGYVPALVEERQLAGRDADRFTAGRHRRDGVWLDPSGEPRTVPLQRELFGG